MFYQISDIETFTSVISWMPLERSWDGGVEVDLTCDEAKLLESCLVPLTFGDRVRLTQIRWAQRDVEFYTRFYERSLARYEYYLKEALDCLAYFHKHKQNSWLNMANSRMDAAQSSWQSVCNHAVEIAENEWDIFRLEYGVPEEMTEPVPEPVTEVEEAASVNIIGQKTLDFKARRRRTLVPDSVVEAIAYDDWEEAQGVGGKGGNCHFYYRVQGEWDAGDDKFDGGWWGDTSTMRTTFSDSKNSRLHGGNKCRRKWERSGRYARRMTNRLRNR